MLSYIKYWLKSNMGCGKSKSAHADQRLLDIAKKKKIQYVGVVGVAYAETCGPLGRENMQPGESRQFTTKSAE